MSKIVLVCLRAPTPPQVEATRQSLGRFLETLRPDNLPDVPTAIADDGRGLFLGIFNPVAGTLRECSAYAGWLADSRAQWWQPRSEVPDGSFVLFRSDAERVEVLADFVASRTIWIAKTDDIFVASTSQRAIPWFLGSFKPNRRAILWMLSSGSLGPGHSWDERAHPLGPAGQALLDRRRWNLRVEEPPISLHVDPVEDEVHRGRLRAAMDDTCAGLDLDRSMWALPLSGGRDCRAILLRMQHRGAGLRCVTWGLREALNKPGTDAFVAREVAHYLGLPHEYVETNPSDDPPERILRRFLVAGEGRIDHVSAYMDGFELWRSLSARGITGIIRGDQAFGQKRASSADEARLTVGLAFWSDYRNVPALADLSLRHLGEQELPPALKRKPGESPPDWRDRLVHAFRIPSVYAALSDLKSPYVEIANPLLVRRIVELARSHPTHLRTEKKILRDLAAETNIPVNYADARATAAPDNALAHPSVTEFLLDEISSDGTRKILSADLVSLVAERLAHASSRRGTSVRRTAVKRALKRLLPTQLSTAVARKPERRTLLARRLALRAYLITRMAERLNRDARSIQ